MMNNIIYCNLHLCTCRSVTFGNSHHGMEEKLNRIEANQLKLLERVSHLKSIQWCSSQSYSQFQATTQSSFHPPVFSPLPSHFQFSPSTHSHFLKADSHHPTQFKSTIPTGPHFQAATHPPPQSLSSCHMLLCSICMNPTS